MFRSPCLKLDSGAFIIIIIIIIFQILNINKTLQSSNVKGNSAIVC